MAGMSGYFFETPVLAVLARKLGTLLLTQTMNMRPEIGMDSYDRLFPSQDTLPKGGFGNLMFFRFGHFQKGYEDSAAKSR
jgi:hypothetical protein